MRRGKRSWKESSSVLSILLSKVIVSLYSALILSYIEWSSNDHSMFLIAWVVMLTVGHFYLGDYKFIINHPAI